MELEHGADSTVPTVTLTIPGAPEYVGIARLAVLGIASRMGFSYDEIEDLRLAVAEVCTGAIERSREQQGAGPMPLITVVSHIDGDALIVDVEDAANASDADAGGADEEMNSHEISALLVEILVDEVTTHPLPGGGTRVRLVKRVSGNAGADMSALLADSLTDSLGNGR